MAKVLVAEEDTLPGSCGVGIIYEFELEDEENIYDIFDDERFSSVGGAGWTTAGFIDNEDCKDVWRYLTKRFKVAYTTPIRTNTNSGNKFFFAVFDGQAYRAKTARSSKWPFNEDTK